MIKRILILAFTFALAACARADIEDTISESFDVGPGGLLTVDSDLGSIEVKANRGRGVRVEVVRTVDTNNRSRAEDVLENLEISFDQSGDDVTVTARFDSERKQWWRNRNPLRLRYIIEVPRQYNVDLKTAGGSISVDDLQGKVRSRTSGGSLKFGDIEGPVHGRTSGGSITLKGCEGEADVKTSGGSITVGQVSGPVQAHTSGGSIRIDRAAGDVVAETSGGSIRVDEVFGSINAGTSGGSVTARITRQPGADCRLTTSGGSVTVHMSGDVRADIDASTSGGRVISELDVEIEGERKKKSLRGELNGGGPEIYLRTSGGNIYLKSL